MLSSKGCLYVHSMRLALKEMFMDFASYNDSEFNNQELNISRT